MQTAQLIRGRELTLPPPAPGSRVSLRTALRNRRTTREINAAPLPIQLLSDLLWSAWGVNRVQGPFGQPGRTAASASNSQEIDLYVALEQGAYRYEARPHRLEPVIAGDIRLAAMTPGQRGIDVKPPVQLVYIADVDRLANTRGFQEPGLQDAEIQKAYYYVDTGLIAGNVYLFAAARGLAAWFHNCDRDALTRHLDLRAGQRVLFAQSVGYPG